MPAAREAHERTADVWQTRASLGASGSPTLARVRRVANAIAAFEPLTMVVAPGAATAARALLDARVEVVGLPIDDSWLRDSGPIVVLGHADGAPPAPESISASTPGARRSPRRTSDAAIAERLLGSDSRSSGSVGPACSRAARSRSTAQGLLVTTEQCLLNPNRNPGVEPRADRAGAARPSGRRADRLAPLRARTRTPHTDGHDGQRLRVPRARQRRCCRRARRRAHLDHRADAPGEPRSARRRARRGLRPLTRGRAAARRLRTTRAATEVVVRYANFYTCNGAAIVPVAGTRSTADIDEEACIAARADARPRGRRRARAGTIAFGGGGVHCDHATGAGVSGLTRRDGAPARRGRSRCPRALPRAAAGGSGTGAACERSCGRSACEPNSTRLVASRSGRLVPGRYRGDRTNLKAFARRARRGDHEDRLRLRGGAAGEAGRRRGAGSRPRSCRAAAASRRWSGRGEALALDHELDPEPRVHLAPAVRQIPSTTVGNRHSVPKDYGITSFWWRAGDQSTLSRSSSIGDASMRLAPRGAERQTSPASVERDDQRRAGGDRASRSTPLTAVRHSTARKRLELLARRAVGRHDQHGVQRARARGEIDCGARDTTATCRGSAPRSQARRRRARLVRRARRRLRRRAGSCPLLAEHPDIAARTRSLDSTSIDRGRRARARVHADSAAGWQEWSRFAPESAADRIVSIPASREDALRGGAALRSRRRAQAQRDLHRLQGREITHPRGRDSVLG